MADPRLCCLCANSGVAPFTTASRRHWRDHDPSRRNTTNSNGGDGIDVDATETAVTGDTADHNRDLGIDAMPGVERLRRQQGHWERQPGAVPERALQVAPRGVSLSRPPQSDRTAANTQKFVIAACVGMAAIEWIRCATVLLRLTRGSTP